MSSLRPADAARWVFSLAAFLFLLGVFSGRLGIEPVFSPDDYEYTYPSFSLAERGNFGSPLLGPTLNIENRTYVRPVYYYATLHAALIRASSDDPQAIPLANTLHFALLAAAGTLFLARRGAFLGVSAFLCALVTDGRLIEAARRGRPDMTAAFYLFLAVLALWLWQGEARRRPGVLAATSTALTAGILSHPSAVLFAAVLLLAFSPSLVRSVPRRTLIVGLLPLAAIPLLWGYFILTDSLANIAGQLAVGLRDEAPGVLAALARHPEWGTLRDALAFVQEELSLPGLWLALASCLALPGIAATRFSPAARFFGTVYGLFFVVRFLFLEQPLPAYRVLDRPVLHLVLALVAEAAAERLGEAWRGRGLVTALRMAFAAVLLCVGVSAASRFRSGLDDRPLPYAQVSGALVDALSQSGARPGDRVFAPSAFAFHLRRDFDVVAQPAPAFYSGRWSPAFRERLREIWGQEAQARADDRSLCWAMGLAFIRPEWILSWNEDDRNLLPFRTFLRNFPDLPGIQLAEIRRTPLPSPYQGVVRVYHLTLSDPVRALERTTRSDHVVCP
jgi:hypothetical protein